MKEISSKQNQLIKDINKARLNKGIWTGAFIVEGFRLCEEAIKSGLKIEAIFLAKHVLLGKNKYSLGKYLEADTEIYILDNELFDYISKTKNSQGIIMIVEGRDTANISELSNLISKNESLSILVMENLQDPGNLGTMLRTAYAFGYDAAITVGNSARVNQEKVLRSAMGAAFHLPIFEIKETNKLIELLKANKIDILAMTLEGVALSEYKRDKKISLWIGNEGNGLTDNLISLADSKITIPMPGGAESLNAAIAAAIALYELK